MAVRIFYTKLGQVMGEVKEHTKLGQQRSVEIEGPVFLHITQQGVMLQPILMGVEEKSIELQLDDTLFGTIDGFTPVPELRNEYSKQFGSGIQLLTR